VVVGLVAGGCAGCSGDDTTGSGGRDRGSGEGGGEEVRFAPVASSAGSFLEVNGWMWFYTTADGIRFDEITAMPDELHRDGIRVLGIYSPYDGDPDKWLGCVARDFYATPPEVGSLDDFAALVDGAHRRGMKVVAYFGNLNVDRRSELFRTAERQYAAGERTSREVSAFRWADDDRGELPTPAFGPSEWAWSETAGAWCWAFWGEPGFDLDLPGARAEVARAERFWLDRGLDGFMFDSGVADPELQHAMVEIPLERTPGDKWLTFEATDAEQADTYAEFGLTSWFNLEDNDEDNDYSLVAAGPATADDLDEAVAGAGEAHAAGKLTTPGAPGSPRPTPTPACAPRRPRCWPAPTSSPATPRSTASPAARPPPPRPSPPPPTPSASPPTATPSSSCPRPADRRP
jgi:glycosidase